MDIDVTFDFRTDANGKDPDSASPTLKAYQRYLYSKPLPNGEIMELDRHLKWKDFIFSSDSILHGFTNWEKYQNIISEVDPEVINNFIANDYCIGGEIIFPCYRVPGVMTINQARGCNPKIRDRIDLTLECIRRFYVRETSPLYKCLCGYKSFFDLFLNFKGYVDFFFLQDLVSEDYSHINYLCWFDNFNSSCPLPKTPDEYVDYIDKVLAFNATRNERIENWCKAQL